MGGVLAVGREGVLVLALSNVRDLPKVYLICLIFSELSRTAKHGFNCAGGQSMVPFNNKLVAVRRDQLHIHRFRALTATVLTNK